MSIGLGSTVEEVLKSANNKQDKLVSGTNIKTINGQSILGSGDLAVSGGASSDTPVIISIASTNGYWDGEKVNGAQKIRVRIISGTLQVGDILEICRPIYKVVFNRVNGKKTNIRYKQRLQPFVSRTITAVDVLNLQNGKNILVLTVNYSQDSINTNKGFKYSCTKGKNSAPRTVRIVRPTIINSGSTQNMPISNYVYITRAYGTSLLKPM